MGYKESSGSKIGLESDKRRDIKFPISKPAGGMNEW